MNEQRPANTCVGNCTRSFLRGFHSSSPAVGILIMKKPLASRVYGFISERVYKLARAHSRVLVFACEGVRVGSRRETLGFIY